MSLGASGRSSALHGVPGRSRAHFSWTEIKAGTKSRHCLYEEKCYVRYDCRIKTMFCSSLSPGSCLIYVICVSLRIMVSNTYCVVFLFCLSSSCIVCAQCCQYLWIVHSWLLIRFSLTYIYKLFYQWNTFIWIASIHLRHYTLIIRGYQLHKLTSSRTVFQVAISCATVVTSFVTNLPAIFYRCNN
jgi:hypothetical protein